MNSILAIVLLGCVVAAQSSGLLGAGYGYGLAGRGGLGYGHGIGHGVGIGNGLGYGHGLGYGRRLGHGLGYGQGIGYGRRLGHGCAGYGCGVRRLGHGGLRGVGIHGLGRRGLGGLGIHGAIAGSYTARGANIGLNNAFEGSDEFVGVGNFNFQGAKGKAASHVPAGAAPATAPAVIGRQWGAGSARQWQAASADRAASGSGVAASARQASRTAQQEAQASFTQNAVSQGAGSAGAAYAFARNIPYNGIQAVGVAPANPQVGAADISVPANQAGGGAQVGVADIGAAVFANQRGDASVAGGAGYGDGGYGGKAY